jgi:membrane protein required for beta-lactamase induction
MVLGPMGAVLYRLTVELLRLPAEPAVAANDPFRAARERLYWLLAWLPAHLAALSYAVMGSFVHALHAWQGRTESAEEGAVDNRPASHRLLLLIGHGALQFDKAPAQDHSAIREALGLCGRSLIAWVTVLALLTLAGWTS